jgi:transcriptional regulator with XRE-family HTH domain
MNVRERQAMPGNVSAATRRRTPDGVDLGRKIRELRKAKSLSLKQVAEGAGVSASLVSQIENNRVDPSLSTLRKIALTMEVPVLALIAESGPEDASLIPKEKRRRVSFPGGSLEYEIIHSELAKKMGIMIGTLQPGGMTSEEPLAHAGEECLVILTGALRVEFQQSRRDLRQGDSLYFDSSAPHRLVNLHRRACRFYLIITPPKF